MTWLTVVRGAAIPRSGSSTQSRIVDRPHPVEAVRERFTRPGPFECAGLCWSVVDPGSRDSSGGVWEAWGPTFELVEQVGWLADPVEVAAADPADVVKQVSFLHASDAVTFGEFRSHYRDHVALARRLMPALWQYVQYDVVAVTGREADRAKGIVAVSVLWFRSTHDFLNRYFLTRADAEEFRSHEGFLDLRKAFSVVMTSAPEAASYPTSAPPPSAGNVIPVT